MASDGSLLLSPADTLKFRFELKKQIPALLKLTNPGSTSVAFKVKTTSPKKYVVRPNTGVIPPGGVAEVKVIMQDQKEYPPDLANCKDKFLVQSLVVTSSQADTLSATVAVAAAVPNSGEGKEKHNSVKTAFDEVFAAPGAAAKEARIRVAYVSPAPPPSPVAEEGPSGGEGFTPVGTPGFSPASGDGPSQRAEASLANRERAAAVDVSVKMQKEMQTMRQQLAERDAKLAQLRGGGGGVAAARGGLVPFTLVHLLLTALIAFVLGRYL